LKLAKYEFKFFFKNKAKNEKCHKSFAKRNYQKTFRSTDSSYPTPLVVEIMKYKNYHSSKIGGITTLNKVDSVQSCVESFL